ncbi:hypothetical protein C1645_840733 [Glomus cerebriforme]|uniref:Uncharacterized protein n=1 Tax=Glomus cerebriforme TaxID=658196 RepID=A0A397S9M7_9GLOM|nr:hypothetical protein C1645_840733 [Glomus cerebriforme]
MFHVLKTLIFITLFFEIIYAQRDIELIWGRPKSDTYDYLILTFLVDSSTAPFTEINISGEQLINYLSNNGTVHIGSDGTIHLGRRGTICQVRQVKNETIHSGRETVILMVPKNMSNDEFMMRFPSEHLQDINTANIENNIRQLEMRHPQSHFLYPEISEFHRSQKLISEVHVPEV